MHKVKRFLSFLSNFLSCIRFTSPFYLPIDLRPGPSLPYTLSLYYYKEKAEGLSLNYWQDDRLTVVCLAMDLIFIQLAMTGTGQ
jgi:hypothetical protein